MLSNSYVPHLRYCFYYQLVLKNYLIDKFPYYNLNFRAFMYLRRYNNQLIRINKKNIIWIISIRESHILYWNSVNCVRELVFCIKRGDYPVKDSPLIV